MRNIRSMEDGTFKNVLEAEFPYNETYKYILLENIALSLGRIADMLAELRGYTVRYDEERKEE